MGVYRCRERVLACLAIAMLLLVPALPAVSGNVSFVTLNYSADRFVPEFHYSGPVVEGDAASLAALIDSYVDCTPATLDPNGSNCAVVTLNSPGGNYREGLRLAALMRDRAIATVVEETAECYSACAFAFLGGSGFSSQDGVGAYIDRMIEPGGILGFHAPYFASDSLDGLVAEYGLDEVLGASRNDVSLMVQQLVEWNVNPKVLGHIVNMGPNETYDIISGEDYTLIWAQLPPAPSHYWNSNSANAIRNACINLLAYHLNALPSAVSEQVSIEPQVNLARTEQAKLSLTGFRINGGGPLGPGICGLSNEQFTKGGDIDLALYSTAGLSGLAQPVVSLFNRVEGWSTMGSGGTATRRNMQKGSMSHLFVDVLAPVEGPFVNFMQYLPLRKFALLDAQGMRYEGVAFPESGLPLMLVGASEKTKVLTYGQQQIIIKTGSELLYTTAMDNLANRTDREVGLVADYGDAFVIRGQYASGRPYLWVGMKGGNGAAALVRIEPTGMPDDVALAMTEQGIIACSFAFQGRGPDCK